MKSDTFSTKREIVIPLSGPRKKKLLKSSSLRRLFNYIGKRKNFLDCFGGCGDSLWWKEDTSIAFTKPEPADSGMENEQHFNFRNKCSDEPRIHVDITYGMMICFQCFVKKTEQELMLIFDNVKMQWMKNKSTQKEIQKIKGYKLLVPVRTTKRVFKKEILDCKNRMVL